MSGSKATWLGDEAEGYELVRRSYAPSVVHHIEVSCLKLSQFSHL